MVACQGFWLVDQDEDSVVVDVSARRGWRVFDAGCAPPPPPLELEANGERIGIERQP